MLYISNETVTVRGSIPTRFALTSVPLKLSQPCKMWSFAPGLFPGTEFPQGSDLCDHAQKGSLLHSHSLCTWQNNNKLVQNPKQ